MKANETVSEQDFWQANLEEFIINPLLHLGNKLKQFENGFIGEGQYESLIYHLSAHTSVKAEQKDVYQLALNSAQILYEKLKKEKANNVQFRIESFKHQSQDAKIDLLNTLKVNAFNWEELRKLGGIIEMHISDFKRHKVESLLVNINGNDTKISVKNFEQIWANQRSNKIGIYRNTLPNSSALFIIITEY